MGMLVLKTRLQLFILQEYKYQYREMGNFTGFEKSEDFYIHPRLGQIKRLQKQDGPQMIQHKVIVQSEEAVQRWEKRMCQINASPWSAILFLPKTHFTQRVGYCGNQCQVFMLFDDYMFSLKDEIKNRRVIKRHFPQSSVWQIFYKLIKAESFLQKMKLRIGNVKPENIIVNQEGQVKIISQFSWPSLQYTIMGQFQEQNSLFSPQQLAIFQKIQSQQQVKSYKKKQRQQSNPEKVKPFKPEVIDNSDNASQIFSIGATLLQICSLQDSAQIYFKNSINQLEVLKKIAKMEENYSSSLSLIISEMLNINSQKRIKTEFIQKMLSKHETAILSHKPFDLNYKKNDSFIKNSSTWQTQDSIPSARVQKKRQNSSIFPFLRFLSKNEDNGGQKLPPKLKKHASGNSKNFPSAY